MKTTLEILTGARALIQEGWTQHSYGRDAEGIPCRDLADATCFCAIGALIMTDRGAKPSENCNKATLLLTQEIPPEFYSRLDDWNDRPERTQAEVLAAFDRAIEMAGQS